MSRPRPSHPEESPLRGRYLVRNRGFNAYLRASDAFLALARRGGKPPPPPRPKRVLACVGGHLGDAVMATRALSQLHCAIPGVEIGVLSGSWNRPVLESHPHVRWFHAVDHWKLSRSSKPLPARWMEFRRSRSSALRQILALRYDAAVDLYAYYPNSARILGAAQIPVRVGYASGGFGPLYTHALEWSTGRSVAEDHRLAIETLVPGFAWDATARYELPAIGAEVAARVAHKLAAFGMSSGDYVVLHVGVGAAHKQWPLESWVSVARDLVARGARIVLTGTGATELALTRAIEQAAPGVVNVCDQLSWDEFRWSHTRPSGPVPPAGPGRESCSATCHAGVHTPARIPG